MMFFLALKDYIVMIRALIEGLDKNIRDKSYTTFITLDDLREAVPSFE